jgi:hypothetical protein
MLGVSASYWEYFQYAGEYLKCVGSIFCMLGVSSVSWDLLHVGCLLRVQRAFCM